MSRNKDGLDQDTSNPVEAFYLSKSCMSNLIKIDLKILLK